MSFLGFVYMVPRLGNQNPQNPYFWGVNKRFQAKLKKSKNVHIYIYRFQPNFAQ